MGLNKGAHPSALAVAQNKTGKDGLSQLGANFDRSLLKQVMSTGTIALTLLLHETARTVPIDGAWRTELTAALEAYKTWFESEHRSPTS